MFDISLSHLPLIIITVRCIVWSADVYLSLSDCCVSLLSAATHRHRKTERRRELETLPNAPTTSYLSTQHRYLWFSGRMCVVPNTHFSFPLSRKKTVKNIIQCDCNLGRHRIINLWAWALGTLLRLQLHRLQHSTRCFPLTMSGATAMNAITFDLDASRSRPHAAPTLSPRWNR